MAFYQGKIATATYFAAQMLPHLTTVRRIVETIDDDIMRLPEAAFYMVGTIDDAVKKAQKLAAAA